MAARDAQLNLRVPKRLNDLLRVVAVFEDKSVQELLLPRIEAIVEELIRDPRLKSAVELMESYRSGEGKIVRMHERS